MTTPEEGLAAIHARFGAHPGHRALHAKGVICAATFTATPEAAALTRAGHMSGEPIPATARLSNGGGDPTVPDYAPDVRGLAVAFHLADGTRTDILAQTLPRFPFPDERGFFDALAISKPSLSALLKLPGFAVRNPRALAELPKANKVLGRLRQLRRAPLLPLPRLQVDRRRRQRALRPLHLAADRRRARHPQVRGEAPRPPTTSSTTSPSGSSASRCGCGSRSRSPPPATTSTTPPRSGRTSASGSTVGTLEITGDRPRRRRLDRHGPDAARRRDRALGRPRAALPPGRLRPLAPAPHRTG